MGEAAVIVALLLACLVALILVLVARREAAAARNQAAEDAATLKSEARTMLADAQRRERQIARRESELAAERRQVNEMTELAQRRAEQAEADRGAAQAELAAARDEVKVLLESTTGISHEEAIAKQAALAAEDAEREAAATVRRIEARARRTAAERAQHVLATAMNRIAGPTSSQSLVTVVPLPAEELKGRIIGKEGRNIRAFESVTGVNLILDDNSDSVVLSSFDAERREIAEVTLHSLMADGRIHPQRIELAYAEAVAGAPERAVAAGHEAAEAAGVSGLTPEVIEVLGRLRLRASFGQNVLAHLVESAQLAAAMAQEIGSDPQEARRSAFLHDIGKALTVDKGGSHAQIGAELLRRNGESDVVVNAVAAHHDEVPLESVTAVLVQAADACSAARPGARREELDTFLERMTSLESLVAAHTGVRKALVMSAGRDVRVVVEPEVVDDAALPVLAETIATEIDRHATVAGEVTVTVIRELRASATTG